MCPSLVRVLWASNLTEICSPSLQTKFLTSPLLFPITQVPWLMFFLLLRGYYIFPTPRIPQVKPMKPNIKDSWSGAPTWQRDGVWAICTYGISPWQSWCNTDSWITYLTNFTVIARVLGQRLAHWNHTKDLSQPMLDIHKLSTCDFDNSD